MLSSFRKVLLLLQVAFSNVVPLRWDQYRNARCQDKPRAAQVS